MRYVFGPGFGIQRGPSTPSPDPAKLDTAVTVKSVDGAAGVVVVEVPAQDLATHNKLVEVRAYLVPSGTPAPADAASFLASPFPVAVADVSAVQTDQTVSLSFGQVADGQYVGQIVLGFDQ